MLKFPVAPAVSPTVAMADGPNVLGYGDPDVDRAAMEQLKIGNCTTAPSYKMVECAEMLVDTVACADWAFFMKNGTDATTFANLTARAATGRKKTIFLRCFDTVTISVPFARRTEATVWRNA